MAQENIDSMILMVGVGAGVFILLTLVGVGVAVYFWITGERKAVLGGAAEGAEQKEMARTLSLFRKGETHFTTVIDPDSMSLREKLEQLRLVLGTDLSALTVGLALVGLMSLGFLITLLISGNIMIGLAIAAVIGFLPFTVVKQRVKRQGALFERQLADALALACRSLRAGHPLGGSFQMIVDEMDPPVKTVFEEIMNRQEMGMSLDEAIREVASGYPSNDLKLFATSMVIQLKTGGNLAQVMDRLAEVIRDRISIAKKIRVLTAQTQFSKKALMAIPIFLLCYLVALRWDYVKPMFTTFPGKIMLGISFVFLIMGSWVMNKMTELEY